MPPLDGYHVFNDILFRGKIRLSEKGFRIGMLVVMILAAQGILGNMETATEQLASIDLGGMVADVDALVTTAQNSLTETMKKLDTVDFKALNKAISDLSAVVEPLSKVMKAFS